MIGQPGGERTAAIYLAFLTQYRSVTNNWTDAWTDGHFGQHAAACRIAALCLASLFITSYYYNSVLHVIVQHRMPD